MKKRVIVTMKFDGYIYGMIVREFCLYSGGDDEEEVINDLIESARELYEAFKPDEILVYDPETDRTLWRDVS